MHSTYGRKRPLWYQEKRKQHNGNKKKKYVYIERELHVSENSDVLFVCFIFVTELLSTVNLLQALNT